MKFKLYAVYDKVSEEFGPVFQCVNDQVADRAFKQMLKDAFDINDYSLKCLGHYDSEDGSIELVQVSDVRVKTIMTDLEV